MALTPSVITWFAILGPADDIAERTVVLASWRADTQTDRLDGADLIVLSGLEHAKFSKDGETKCIRINRNYVAGELKRKGATISVAAAGTDEIEIDLFLESFEKNLLHSLGYEHGKSLTSTIIKSNKSQIALLADELVHHGYLEHVDADAFLKSRKALIAATLAKTTPS